MTMKLMKKIIAPALALVMMASCIIIAPEKAEAASEPGFEIEINVADETDGLHVAGIAVPEMIVKFRLVPEVTALPADDPRYDVTRESFPDGNSPQDTKVIEYDYKIPAFTSSLSGQSTRFLKLSDIPEISGGTWGAESKIYRYHVNMVAIYRTNDSGTADTSANYLNVGSLLTAPTETEILMDVYIGADGSISSTVMWDKDGEEKLAGFAAPDMMGRAAGPTGGSGISYNVYDVEISTDYVGISSNSVAGKVMYTVILENVPKYLTDNRSDTRLIKSAIVHRNKDSWTDDLSTTVLSSDRVAFKGALADNDKIVFAGMPYEGADGNPIQFSAGIDYGSITDLAGADAKDKYKDSIYYGSNVERIDGSITSMEAFIGAAYASSYLYDAGTGYVKKTSATPMVKDSSTSDNNVRFVVFDPSELVIVGVTVSALPGVIAILAAVAGVAVFVVVRRKNRVRY